MANHKSAEKRIRQTKKRTERNRYVRSAMRTHIRRVREAVEAKDKDKAQAELVLAVKRIDKAASKGVIHKNQASRRVSRLTRLVNGL